MKKIIIGISLMLNLLSYSVIESKNVDQEVKKAIAHNNFNKVYNFVENNNFNPEQLKSFLDLSLKNCKLSRNVTKGIVQLLLGLGLYALLPKIIMQCAGRYGKTIKKIFGWNDQQIQSFGTQIESNSTLPQILKGKVVPIMLLFGKFRPIWLLSLLMSLSFNWYLFLKAFNNLHGRNGELAQVFKIIRYLQSKIEESTKIDKQTLN